MRLRLYNAWCVAKGLAMLGAIVGGVMILVRVLAFVVCYLY